MVDACAREFICRRLLADVCSYCGSRDASESVARRRLLIAFAETCPPPFFLSNVFGFSDNEKVTYRNAHLSHYIWYNYVFISLDCCITEMSHAVNKNMIMSLRHK